MRTQHERETFESKVSIGAKERNDWSFATILAEFGNELHFVLLIGVGGRLMVCRSVISSET